MIKYIHEDEVHNLDAPAEIVPIIYGILRPKSVIDIGCGIGTFLKIFKDFGVDDILGVDGKWVDKDKLYKYIKADEFLEYDLEKEIVLNRYFDLVLSLEVAEHLSESSADVFVKNLINAGKVILFSAAIPMQSGQNHINEQRLSYWEAKFSKFDYVIHDVIRPIFWDNPKVNWWYKQNMVLISHKDYELDKSLISCPMRDVVHYDLFNKNSTRLQEKSRELYKIKNGLAGSRYYLKLLFKSLFKLKR